MKADRVIADQVLQDIADYVIDYKVVSEEALNTCLLYTSDAADDLLCVDLGGRRIIKI